MSRIHDIERQVQSLTADELASFRRWFAEFDAAAWDRQFEGDVKDFWIGTHADYDKLIGFFRSIRTLLERTVAKVDRSL